MREISPPPLQSAEIHVKVYPRLASNDDASEFQNHPLLKAYHKMSLLLAHKYFNEMKDKKTGCCIQLKEFPAQQAVH